MTPQNPNDPTSEEVHEKIHQDLERYGWTILSTIYDEILCSQTFGLQKNFKHPEIEVVGLNDEMSCLFLNTLAQRIKMGQQFTHGSLIDEIIEGYELMLVHNPLDPQGMPLLEGRLRLIWPDSQHRYPWHQDCDSGCQVQAQLFSEQTN
ncbi:MAG: DUF4262 domain-containing protein [SAR324 cluster bacterium]|nr:DUF4262 domain-containing protein [SAR324 cluster bacterium]